MREHFEEYPLCGIVYNQHDELEIWIGSILAVRITPTGVETFGEHATSQAAVVFWREMYRLNPLAQKNFELRQQCHLLRGTVRNLEAQLEQAKDEVDESEIGRPGSLDQSSCWYCSDQRR